MNKNFSKLLVCLLALPLASCGGNEEGGVTKLSFFSWGNETETKLNEELVAQFNEMHKGEIEVKFTPVPSGDYESNGSIPPCSIQGLISPSPAMITSGTFLPLNTLLIFVS